MDWKLRYAAGGLGGASPVLVLLLALNWSTAFANVDFIALAGYTVKALILFLVGGAFVVGYKTETSFWKLAHLGVSGPALFLALASGATAPKAVAYIPDHPVASRMAFSIVGSAFAEDAAVVKKEPTVIKTFSIEEANKRESILSRVWEQTKGAYSNSHVWFVVVGTEEDARIAAQKSDELWDALKKEGVAQTKPEEKDKLAPAIYGPYKNLQRYSIVAGEYLDREEAEKVRALLLEHKVKDVRLYNFLIDSFGESAK